MAKPDEEQMPPDQFQVIERTGVSPLTDATLLARRLGVVRDPGVICTKYSPGFDEVWMGRPHAVTYRDTKYVVL